MSSYHPIKKQEPAFISSLKTIKSEKRMSAQTHTHTHTFTGDHCGSVCNIKTEVAFHPFTKELLSKLWGTVITSLSIANQEAQAKKCSDTEKSFTTMKTTRQKQCINKSGKV